MNVKQQQLEKRKNKLKSLSQSLVGKKDSLVKDTPKERHQYKEILIHVIDDCDDNIKYNSSI